MTGSNLFIPQDFTVPTRLDTPDFRLVPLGPEHSVSDYQAWTGSIDHILNTPGFPDMGWPNRSMTLADNAAELSDHAAQFAERSAFAFTVLSNIGDEVIGCVYIAPPRRVGYDADVRSWVRSDHKDLDQKLYDAVRVWLGAQWPFRQVDYAGRSDLNRIDHQ